MCGETGQVNEGQTDVVAKTQDNVLTEGQTAVGR